jgi:hypothetical protein
VASKPKPKPPLGQTKWFRRIEEYAARLAAPAPESRVWWIQEDSSGEVYCYDCVDAVQVLGSLVVWHLLSLLGSSPDVEDVRALCTTAVEACDGGWRGEEDSLRCCDNCHARLSCCLTGYGAKEELSFWEENGPPETPENWQDFEEMLNSIEDEELTRLALLWLRWGLTYAETRHETWPRVQVLSFASTECPRCRKALIPVRADGNDRAGVLRCEYVHEDDARTHACSSCGMVWVTREMHGRTLRRCAGLAVCGTSC